MWLRNDSNPMDWGTDELGHRSAAASGWADELRAADPEDVDDTVAGAVAFAAATDAGEAVDPGTGTAVVPDAAGVAGAAGVATVDAEAVAETPGAAVVDGEVDEPGVDADAEPTLTCSFCRRELPESEALDADGLPIGGVEWVADPDIGEREAYHRECVDAGEGRFLPWGAGGALGDE